MTEHEKLMLRRHLREAARRYQETATSLLQAVVVGNDGKTGEAVEALRDAAMDALTLAEKIK